MRVNWTGGGDQNFGNHMGKKTDDVCRLAFLNVDTFQLWYRIPIMGPPGPPLKIGRLMYGYGQK
jgi:hypothetical protein